MSKYIFFVLSLIVISLSTSCDTRPESSFREISEHDSYTRSIITTDKHFHVKLDLKNINSLAGTTVFSDKDGGIILSSAEFIAPDTLNLCFEAHGKIRDEVSTILTASAYDDGFLQSVVSAIPADNVYVRYSLQTAEFERFGNRFGISVFFPGQDPTTLETLELTFSDLLLISFLHA